MPLGMAKNRRLHISQINKIVITIECGIKDPLEYPYTLPWYGAYLIYFLNNKGQTSEEMKNLLCIYYKINVVELEKQ